MGVCSRKGECISYIERMYIFEIINISCNYTDIKNKNEINMEKNTANAKSARKKIKEKNTVFITDQGNRFHYDLNCGGIKRTIYMIRLSEVRNRKKCSRCET